MQQGTLHLLRIGQWCDIRRFRGGGVLIFTFYHCSDNTRVSSKIYSFPFRDVTYGMHDMSDNRLSW